jgi:hypothetical protein
MMSKEVRSVTVIVRTLINVIYSLFGPGSGSDAESFDGFIYASNVNDAHRQVGLGKRSNRSALLYARRSPYPGPSLSYRSGHYARSLVAPLGKLELRVPHIATGD